MMDNVKKTMRVYSAIFLSILIVSTHKAQSFSAQTGGSNPMNAHAVPSYSAPAFADLDNDGDLDAMVGTGPGKVRYYENTGTVSSASFTQQTGVNNPMNGWDVGTDATVAFVDIDADADYDLFLGAWSGVFHYFENTGSVSSPIFTYRIGVDDPLWVFDVGTASAPRFIDIDDDGDWDMLSGRRSGIFRYYENTGTATSATYIERTGAANPLDGEDVGMYSNPAFIDMDQDGDFDMVSGEEFGTYPYYENTGTRTNPTYVSRTGASNPLNGEDNGGFSIPIFADLDNDGESDLMSGETSGSLFFYLGSGVGGNPLPVELLSFEAEPINNEHIAIRWETATETNNSHFMIERSKDAIDWNDWKMVDGAGNSNSIVRYEEVDFYPYAGNTYYRLKQVDFDGTETYYDPVTALIENTGGIISLYPNPSDGDVTFQIAGDLNINEVRISDATGKVVLEENIEFENSNWKKDLSNLPKGIFMVNITTVNGESFQERLVLK